MNLDKIFYKKTVIYIFIFLIYNVFISLLSQLLNFYDDVNLLNDEWSKWFVFFVEVGLAPLIETLLFQVLIFEIVHLGLSRLRIKFHESIAVLISTIVFAISHSYSLTYIWLTILPGFFLALIYFWHRKDGFKSAFFVVYIVHLSNNLLGFILVDLLEIRI